jgi:hypothetical protein
MKYKLIILFMLFFFSFNLYGQENEINEETDEGTEQLISEEDDTIYVINSFDFNIKGFTRPYALIRKGELYTGTELQGIAALEEYIKDKTQILYNERVLESVSIDYTIAEEREDGKFPVDLTINTKDTWNIVAIPRPRYSTNYGFDLTLKARDYNFLGTMSPLRIDLGYIYDEEGKTSVLFMLDSNIPFRLFDLDWGLKFVHDVLYRHDTEQPYYYKNTTGLYVDIPVGLTTITVGFDETFNVNEENSDIDKPIYGNFQEGLFMTSSPYVSWKIPTGLEVGPYGELTFTPRLSAFFFHEFPKWPLDDLRRGPSMTLNYDLGFDRVDWIVNFKKGLDVKINNSFSYNFFNKKNNTQPWSINYSISGKGHFIITDFFGISTRLLYRQWIFHDNGYTEAGDALRGILNKNVSADNMLSLNLDLPVRVLRFTPSVWLDKPKLRLINFDLHLSPIFDFALYTDPRKDVDFSFKNSLVTGGMEVIVFPEFFRSLFLVVSFGWNLRDFSLKENYEIFIGTEFHY